MPALHTTPAPSSRLTDWPADATVGYLVTPLGGGPALRVTVLEGGTLDVEGIGAYAIAETVPVAERRAGLRALRQGRI